MKKLYIDGVWTEGTSLRTWAVTNPATGQHLEDVAVAAAEDVEETIDRSVRNTLGLWAASCGPFRWIDLTRGPALYARSLERMAPSLCLPSLCHDATLPAPLAALLKQDARGIATGHGFYDHTPEEIHGWEDRQQSHAWLVRNWLDAEFPIAGCGSVDHPTSAGASDLLESPDCLGQEARPVGQHGVDTDS